MRNGIEQAQRVTGVEHVVGVVAPGMVRARIDLPEVGLEHFGRDHGVVAAGRVDRHGGARRAEQRRRRQVRERRIDAAVRGRVLHDGLIAGVGQHQAGQVVARAHAHHLRVHDVEGRQDAQDLVIQVSAVHAEVVGREHAIARIDEGLQRYGARAQAAVAGTGRSEELGLQHADILEVDDAVAVESASGSALEKNAALIAARSAKFTTPSLFRSASQALPKPSPLLSR